MLPILIRSFLRLVWIGRQDSSFTHAKVVPESNKTELTARFLWTFEELGQTCLLNEVGLNTTPSHLGKEMTGYYKPYTL